MTQSGHWRPCMKAFQKKILWMVLLVGAQAVFAQDPPAENGNETEGQTQTPTSPSPDKNHTLFPDEPGYFILRDPAGNEVMRIPSNPTPPPERAPSPEDIYYRNVLDAARECVRGKDHSPVTCWAKASPKKCESLTYDTTERRSWMLCVRTCADASLWSRNFGECKTGL